MTQTFCYTSRRVVRSLTIEKLRYPALGAERILRNSVRRRCKLSGEVAEWPNAAVSKTVAQRKLGPEFKSQPLRSVFADKYGDEYNFR